MFCRLSISGAERLSPTALPLCQEQGQINPAVLPPLPPHRKCWDVKTPWHSQPQWPFLLGRKELLIPASGSWAMIKTRGKQGSHSSRGLQIWWPLETTGSGKGVLSVLGQEGRVGSLSQGSTPERTRTQAGSPLWLILGYKYSCVCTCRIIHVQGPACIHFSYLLMLAAVDINLSLIVHRKVCELYV